MTTTPLCILGDIHGHLQLALCMAAHWQESLGVEFEAVLLCGDVGTFTDDSQLDSTTRRHGKANPCELEFLTQWSQLPQPEWLHRIFMPTTDGGLGLTCPVIMVHGNHEGFTHLATLVDGGIPEEKITPEQLPMVDTGGHISYCPSGWRIELESGLSIAGIGGIERGQRQANYHEMAYLDESAILHLMEQERLDLLFTHQGPSDVQGERNGSRSLNLLLENGIADYWFHGHSTPNMEIGRYGPNGNTMVVPLGDIAFPMKGDFTGDPGKEGWSYLPPDGSPVREAPPCWRYFRRGKWHRFSDGRMISPDLVT